MNKPLGVFCLALVCATAAGAQSAAGYGSITGTVREASGEGIPDTTVIVSNPDLGFERSVITTDDGVFNVPELVPAAGYKLEIKRKGFQDSTTNDIEVSVGATLNFSILLAPETPAPGEPPVRPSTQTQDATQDLSLSLSRREVEALPTADRRLESLVQLAPASTGNPATGVLAFRGEPWTNAFFTDGVFATPTHYIQQPGIAPQLPQDAVSEIQTLSASAPPEIGHAAGGIVNAATRTSGNSLHGELYDYYNYAGLNAANRYAPGFDSSGSQQQGGASAGGAIFPDHLFWFANFEGITGKSEGLNRITNPLLADPLGTSALPAACGAPATPAQCSAALNYVNSRLNVVVPRALSSLDGLARLDFRPNAENSLNLEVNAFHRTSDNGAQTAEVSNNDALLAGNGSFGEETRFAKANWGRSLVDGFAFNDMRASLFRDRSSDYWNSKLFPSTGTLGVNIAGTPFGPNPAFPRVLSEQRWAYADDLSITMNSHLVKVGVEYTKHEDWLNQIYNRNATYDYPSLTAFALDFTSNASVRRSYTNFTQAFGNPVVDVHMPEFSFYVQDTWRPFRRLALNYGVRWEKTFLPKPPNTNGSYYQTGSISSPNRDVAPRLGLSYRIDNHTVIHAGFSEFFQPFAGQIIDALYVGNAIYQQNILLNPNQNGAPYFPRMVPGSTSVPTGANEVVYAVSKFRNPYTEQATITIERQFGSKTTLAVSGIDTRGLSLWTVSDQNIYAPTIYRVYTIDNAAGAAVGTFGTGIYTQRGNSAFSHVYQIDNEGGSRYRALVVKLTQRMAHNLSFQASYTWSHAIDDVSGAPLPVAGFLPSTVYNANYRTDQASSPFDQRHRVVVNWTWQPRLARGNSLAARYLLNGWSLSGIGTFASSRYETPLVQVNGQQFLGVTMAYTSSLTGMGGWSRAPFLPASSLPTGPQYDVDARISRAIPVTERIRARLMLEAFNTFNTQFTTSVNQVAYVATSGVLHPVAGLGAGNAADGYPFGTNARRAQVALRVEF